MVINANLDPKIARQRDIAERQVALFTERYGEMRLDFACHAAFPQMLTTELVYLLRQLLHEQHGMELHWSAAPELLLSNLCDTAGYDLYGMSVGIRRVLLEKLVAKHGRKRLDELAQWMGEYIKYRLEQDFPSRARVFGDPSEWTVLACLKDDEIAQTIKEQLRQLLAETEHPYDRFQLSALVEDHADLLAQQGLQPFKLQHLAQKIESDRLDEPEPDDFIEFIRTIMGFNDFPLLQSKEIFYATISFEETAIDSGDALYPFEFETVQVDERGTIIHREQGQAFAFREPLATDIGLEMVAIPSGKFMMGSPESEHDSGEDKGYQRESPQHEVTVQPFFIGKYPITQSQWRVIADTPQIERELKPDPSKFTKIDNRSVERVSWEEAVEFCQRLSRETGRDYRLPAEAEWEYACRAGTTTPFYFGKTITGNLANYDSEVTYLQEREVKRQAKTTPVDDFLPNAFGLYDMHGSVWEWCLDNWHSNYEGAPTDGSAWLSNEDNVRQVVRGGSWLHAPHNCRSASRYYFTLDYRNNGTGFRVVCEIPRTL
jgi:formylglycine-generating enzyme required for sulfatase activity